MDEFDDRAPLPTQGWRRFRALPLWVQGLAWLAAWPLALAGWLLSTPGRSSARTALAAVLGLVVAPLWLATLVSSPADDAAPVPVALSGPSDSDERVSDPDPGSAPEPDQAPEPEPEIEQAPEPEPEPGAPEPPPKPEAEPAPIPPAPRPETQTLWTVTYVVDGDTVDARGPDGTVERIRVIGIDTPERGQCGFGEASSALKKLVLDKQVALVPGARDDRDRHGRILRYLDVGGTLDAGLSLIEQGLAIARYDSRDGYGRHPREDLYVRTDAPTEHLCESPAAAAPAPAPGGSNPVSVVVFPNCDELRKVYPGGVARTGVSGNLVSGELRPFAIWPHFDDSLYEANRSRDRDGDGIACEK
jgi:micrococcal nuclease